MRAFAQKPRAAQQNTSAKSTMPGRAHFGQRREVNSILHLQRTIGNQAVQRMMQTYAEELKAGLTGTASPRFGHDFSRIPIHPPAAGAIQTQLTINTPGDEYEQEADRISEQVMRMPEQQMQHACACGGGCPECQTEQSGQEHGSAQTKRVGTGDLGQTAAPPIVHEVLRSASLSLDHATRGFMESRFGHDFSLVRVHNDAKAAESSRALGARAYTVGRALVFGSGQYAPGTQTGRRLIAHELTHVVQQNASRSLTAVVQRDSSSDMDASTELTRFNSIYNQVTGAYSFLTQQQTLAIDSIYTEAKKPIKPSLVEELLIALATAGVAGAVSIVGKMLTARIPKVFNVAEAGTTSNELIESHVAAARARVESLTQAAQDAFLDGTESLALPLIRGFIESGKLPVDAFFEGEKKLVLEAGKMAFDKAEQGRVDVLSLATIHPALPVFAARTLLKVADETFKNAYEVQKRETLVKWFSYQAQSRLGAGKPGSGMKGQDVKATNIDHDVKATNMEKFVTSEYWHGDFPGVLFVDAALEYVERPVEGIPVLVLRPQWHIFPLERAYFRGLSQAMLGILGNTPLRDLRLPIVYRVASYSSRSSLRVPRTVNKSSTESQFSLAVNESGKAWLSKTMPWHKEGLQGIGGAGEVHRRLGGNTMVLLGVKADKD